MSERDEPPRAVVDTNIWVSALILRRGLPFAVLRAIHDGAFRLVVSPWLRDEYADVLSRPKFRLKYGVAPQDVTAFLTVVALQAEIITLVAPAPIAVRDPDDARVLALAFAGRVDYLACGDNDPLVLAKDPGLGALKSVTAQEFLSMLAEQ